MIRSTLIALAAVAAIGAGTAATAQAKTNFDIDVHLGGFGYYGGYYDDYCGWKWVKVKKWNWNHSHYKIVKQKVYVCY